MNKSMLFIFIIVSSFISCRKVPDQFYKYRTDFFPLEVGNEWIYRSDKFKLTIHVKDLVEIENFWFAVVEESLQSDNKGLNVDQYYYYYGQGEIIYKLIPKDQSLDIPKVKQGLNALAGTAWPWIHFGSDSGYYWVTYSRSFYNYKYIDQYKITLVSQSDTIFINDKKYYNCYKYYFDDLSESDTEFYEWYVKGIGLIKRSPSGVDDASSLILVDYKIHKINNP